MQIHWKLPDGSAADRLHCRASSTRHWRHLDWAWRPEHHGRIPAGKGRLKQARASLFGHSGQESKAPLSSIVDPVKYLRLELIQALGSAH